MTESFDLSTDDSDFSSESNLAAAASRAFRLDSRYSFSVRVSSNRINRS